MIERQSSFDFHSKVFVVNAVGNSRLMAILNQDLRAMLSNCVGCVDTHDPYRFLYTSRHHSADYFVTGSFKHCYFPLVVHFMFQLIIFKVNFVGIFMSRFNIASNFFDCRLSSFRLVVCWLPFKSHAYNYRIAPIFSFNSTDLVSVTKAVTQSLQN